MYNSSASFPKSHQSKLDRIFALILSIGIFPLGLIAQEEDVSPASELELIEKYFEMSPAELLNLPTRITTGSEQDWLKTPAAAYVITRGEILKSGHRHIAEVLRMAPGVMVSQSAADGWAVSTRTFQNLFANMQLVLQDGREIYTPAFGGVFWSTSDLPLEILDSVEVIRGPGATLWGSNAVNGIINIQTLHAKDAQNNILTLGGGNEDYGNFTFRQGGEIFGGHYYTWGKWTNQRRWIKFPEDKEDEDHTELRKVGFRADLPGFGEEGWTLRAEYFDHHTIGHFRGQFTMPVDINGTPQAAPTYLTDLYGPSTQEGGTIHGSWRGTIADHFEWKLNSYYHSADREWHNVGLDYNINTFEFDFQIGREIGRHDLRAGIRHRTHDFSTLVDDMNLPAGYPPTAVQLFTLTQDGATERLNSAFLQDTITLREDLRLLVGTKFEDNPTGNYWAPSARLWWHPDPKTTFWLSYSNARQLPGYNSRYANITVGYAQLGPNFLPLSLQADARSQPAELEQWEIGWRKLLSQELSVDVALFLGDYDDLTLNGEHGLFANHHNTDTAEAYGGELAINWQPNPHWQIRTSVSYTDTDIEGLGSNTDQYSHAKWRGNLLTNYSPNEDWTYHLNFYGSERAFDEVPGYIRTDLGATWTPNHKWDVSAFVQNVFDPLHPEDYSSFYGEEVQEVPRTAYLQVRRWF